MTTLRYKVPKKQKLENKKKKIEIREIEQNALFEPKPPREIQPPSRTQEKLLLELKEKTDTVSQKTETLHLDALDAHSHIANIADPFLRESCHKLVDAHLRSNIQKTLAEITAIQKDIPTEETELHKAFGHYKDLLNGMLEDEPEITHAPRPTFS